MKPNPEPTGGTNPKVTVVEPLTNKPVTSDNLPVFSLEDTPEETSDNLPIFNFDEPTDEVEQPIQEPTQTLPKTPEELFGQPLAQENVRVEPPITDISKSVEINRAIINNSVNPIFMPNTGQVERGETGAPVIHKEGEIKSLKIAQYPNELNLNPDVLRTTVRFFDNQTPFQFLENGKIPPLSSMTEDARLAFSNVLGADNMPAEKMLYPDVKSTNLDETFLAINKVDLDLERSLSQNQDEIEGLAKSIHDSKSIEEYKDYKDYKLKWDDLTSRDLYFNVWKSVMGEGKSEIYPEEVSSKIQSLRNEQKYGILEGAGFVNNVPSDIPKNIQDFLKSSEYVNSTAKDKKLYAKMLWRTNMDKYPTPQDLYSKIANTFTPSVSLLFLKQKAKDNLKLLKEDFEKNEAWINNEGVLLDPRMPNLYSQSESLYKKIIDADFENDNTILQKMGYSLKHHGTDAVPFVSAAFALSNSIDLYQVINRAGKNGYDSLNKSEKILFDSYSVFNTYSQLSQPDMITQAVNAAPGIIAFIGELGMTKGVPKFTEGLLKSGASKAMKVAMDKSPSLLGSSVDILRAIDGVSGGSLRKFALNAGKLVTVPTGWTAQMAAARAMPALTSAISMTTDMPTEYLDEDDMKYIGEIVPTDRPDFMKNMLVSGALESANIATLDVAKVIGSVQNNLIGSVISKFEKGSPQYRMLQWLQANGAENIAAANGKQTGVEAFLARARSLSPATVVPDLLSFGVALPRAEHLILGTKDGLWSNPHKTLVDDIQHAAIGLAAPILGGKLIGIGSLVNFKRIIFRNESKFHDFNQTLYTTPKEEFMSEDFLNTLRKDIDFFAKTGNKEKDKFGKLMQARLEHRLDFENGKIEGAVGETYFDYIDNAVRSQSEMTSLLEQVRDGKVEEGFIDKAIESASDNVTAREFQFHKDLINSYATSGKEGESLKEYVDKHKKVYFDIKQEFASLQSLRTAPDWVQYERRINEAMLPSDYKVELKKTYDALKADWDADTQNLYGNANQSRVEMPEIASIESSDNKHTFTKQGDGSYKFTSSNETQADADISFRMESMAITDVLNVFNISRNSDMTPDLKDKMSRSVKERAMSEFENKEFFSDFGGRENMSQLLDVINTVSQSSPLTVQEKNSLTNAVSNVLEVEVRRDGSLENYEKVKSSIQRMVQNSNILEVKNVLDFHSKMSKLVMRQAVKNMTNSQLEYEAQTQVGDGVKEILKDEITERKNLGLATEKEISDLMKVLNLNPIETNVDFETLRKNNPTVERISKSIFELQKLGLISDKGVTIIEGILCSVNPEYLNIKRVTVSKETRKEPSRYNDKSNTITISHYEGMPEHELISEIAEEVLHSVQHNIATSLGNGGMIGEFLLTDAQIIEICGTSRTDAVANIARWYKSKDYDYNNFLRLKDKLPSEMTEGEKKEFYAIKDMLQRFGTKHGQKWDNLNFIDTENRQLGWSFTTESLVRNWNRYNQMKTLSRPDGRRYTSAEAFYYSAYSHEYFARTLGDYQISDVSKRISGDAPIEGMIQKTSNFISKVIKLPMITRMFRSEVFNDNQKPLRDMMSPVDEANLRQMVETKGALLNEQQRVDFDKILNEIPVGDKKNHEEIYRDLINDTSNPQALSDFILSITDSAIKQGYDASITGDIVNYLNKEINITGKDIESFRDEEQREIRYVSNTMKALESLKIEKTSGANWIDKILSSGGKKVEIERYGLDNFLRVNKNPTKQEVVDFLSDKVMKVRDVVLGGEVDKVYAELNKEVEASKNALHRVGFVEIDGRDSEFESEFAPAPIGTTPGSSGDNSKEISGWRISDKKSDEENLALIKSHIEKSNIEDSDYEAHKILMHFNAYVKAQKGLGEYVLNPDNKTFEGDGETRWSSYTTFPLNNYRELLPVIDTEKKLFSHESHFAGIQNQLYHNRLNDVTTESGKRLLLSEEMQGDWTQHEPYDNGDKRSLEHWEKEIPHLEKQLLKVDNDGLVGEIYNFKDEFQKIAFRNNLVMGIEDAKKNKDYYEKNIKNREKDKSPYTKTSDWVRAAIKRMIKMAVDEGKDGIGWTPAHIQVERWSNATRAVVDNIYFEKVEGSKDLGGSGSDAIKVNASLDGNAGENFTFYKGEDGNYYDSHHEGAKKSMNDYFGSEIAKQILSGETTGKIEGENIIVGGQGYIDIYDKTAVDVANKLGKKYGVTVTQEEVKTEKEDGTSLHFLERFATGNTIYGDHKVVKVHSLIFNEAMRLDIKNQNELLIFAKREDKSPPTPTGEFKNIVDLIDNSIKLEKEKEIEAYRGIEGLNNLEKTNPTEYKRLFQLLEDAKKNLTNPDDRSYYVNNYLAGGWFREKLKGQEFWKSKIDDSKMTILQTMPKYKSPSTQRGFSNIIRFIGGNADGISREIAKKDVEEVSGHNIFLEDIVSHKELFESYPEIRNAKVEFYWGGEKDHAHGFKYSSEGEHVIAINIDKVSSEENALQSFKETILHEAQHIIQDVEGFHKGTSEEYFRNNFFVYNVYQAKERGDKFITDALSMPENKDLSNLVDKISEGKELSDKDFQPGNFIKAKDFNNSHFQIMSYMGTVPEYRWAYDMYRRGIGEIESFDVENQSGELPATLLLSLGEAIKQQGYDQLIKPQDIIPILEKGNTIGAKRNHEEDDKKTVRYGDGGKGNILVHNYYDTIKQGHIGLFLSEVGSQLGSDYGENKAYFKISKDAIGIKLDGSYQYLDRNNLLEKKINFRGKENLNALHDFEKEMTLEESVGYTQDYLQLEVIADLKRKGITPDYIEYYHESYSMGEFREIQILNPNVIEKLENYIPEREIDSGIGAKREEKKIESPVDISWFKSLFEDKDTIVGTRDIERVIKDIDDNVTSYIGGDIKTLAEARRAASGFARNLVELWKQRVIAKELPKSSIYERKEIARLVTIPLRKKLQDYTKDIQYIENIVSNANFRKALSETKKEQMFARNRFLRFNKDDVTFYSAVNKLTSINTRMFEDIDSLNKYNELLTSKPELVNVQEFKAEVDKAWNDYLDWKKQFNDQYTGKGEVISEDESILNEQMFYDKKQIIKEAVSKQLVNRGLTDLDKNYVDAFSRLDIDAMDEKEIKEYESALKYLLLNPENINHKVVKIVNKYQAQTWYEKASGDLSRDYINIINRKSLPSTNFVTEYFKGLVPGVGRDKLGNISPYNVKSILEIAEGMSNKLPGVLQSEITEPINRDYQQFLINKADAIRKISAKGKYSISENHRIGIKALLSQKPQFAITANTLKALDEKGIDISNLAVGEVISSKNTEPDKVAAYQYVLGQSNAMIKESILISFGVKPDETWNDNEMKEILGDVSVMSRRSEGTLKTELDELLKDSGVTSLKELVDGIEADTHKLTEREQKYLDTLRETMNETKEGKYSRGLGLKGASEKLYGIEFQDIEDYFPLLRYKTYLTTEKYLDPERNEDANDAKVFYGIYNDFQMNTSFLEKRKPTVMALQTNAYEAVAKRLDQQIYYLNHVEHQNYLKSLFRTDAFYGKGDMFNTESSNQIVDLLNGNYNRGVNEARAEIMKDVSANFIYNAVQRYKALYVGDWLKSPGQLSTIIFNMARMKGNARKKFSDTAVGCKQMVNSYIEGSEENIFLSKFAPEVYYRGLNTYDFVGLDSGDNFSETTGSKGFGSESARNSGKSAGVLQGLERGIYRTNKSRVGNIVSEIKNPYSNFGAEFNLAGLKFHDRVAARASFFSSYKNYCDYLGVKVDMINPSQEALNYSLESVRETQFTDNPLQRSGLSYNLIAGGSRQFPGDWTMINMLAFKSFAINERQTLMKASERMKNNIYDKKWKEAADDASYFAYSFGSKVAFNYIKLVCQKYILSVAAANLLSDDKDQKSQLIKESIGTSTQFSNVALHAFLDYFALAEPVKWGASIGLKYLEEKAKGELSPEEREKYKSSDMLNQDMLSGFADDVARNMVNDASEAVQSNREYGILNPETLRDDARFLLLISQMRYGIPGASLGNNLLREMNKQKKFMERSKGNSENSLYND